MRVLLLGGTTEASDIARLLATAGIAGVFSYAGRTTKPIAQPLPTRTGGFGGIEGLSAYLNSATITHVVDATHPFASQISANALAACAQTHIPLIAFERQCWARVPGDTWLHVNNINSAVAALPDHPARVFLAIGKQSLGSFAAKPQHVYLLRIIDPLTLPLGFPNSEIVYARGPFTVPGDIALMKKHAISHVVAKNAGGEGSRAKLDAARELGLPVILIDRPTVPSRRTVHSIDEVMIWLGHSAHLGV